MGPVIRKGSCILLLTPHRKEETLILDSIVALVLVFVLQAAIVALIRPLLKKGDK